MKFQDAVKKSIIAFYKGKSPKATAELKGEEGLIYTPEYFDDLEDQMNLSEEEQDDEV